MKTQTLYKRLSMPLLLTVISVTGIEVTPARSASLIGSQSTAINTNPEATLIANNPCSHRRNCTKPPGADPNVAPADTDNPTRDPIEKPEVEKPEVEKPEVEKPEVEKPVIEKPVIEKPVIEKPVDKERIIYQRQRLQ